MNEETKPPVTINPKANVVDTLGRCREAARSFGWTAKRTDEALAAIVTEGDLLANVQANFNVTLMEVAQ